MSDLADNPAPRTSQRYPAAAGSGGGHVVAVGGGAAASAGLRVGDVVLAVDGTPLRDVIDWLWLTDEPAFELEVVRGGTPLMLRVERTSGEPLGVEFASPLFDPIRECDNACVFCFVSQLPPDLRPSLSVRDDDYRLSFLGGNFVTLTNLTDEDVDRILGQHLSPLHVSVHAVDPVVRQRLVCPSVEDHALETLDTLLAAGIEAHVQIVLVPGLNDGVVLDQTLTYLADREGILSVGCVPMGFTAHQRRFSGSYDQAGAQAVLSRVSAWQGRLRAARGIGWVYAADEFFLLAGEPMPSTAEYDGFPQYENGIGTVAAFVEEFTAEAGAAGGAPAAGGRLTAVTGTLFAPVLREALDRGGLPHVGVLPVTNRLFGGNVSVAGLLGGEDIVRAVRDDGATGTYLVPDVVVNSDGLLLDDVPAASLPERSGGDIRIVGSDGAALARALITGTGRTRP